MRLWPFGRQAEERAAPVVGPVPLMYGPQQFGYAGMAPYAHVDGSKINIAQQSIAVSASVDLIASLVSELTIDVFTGQGGKRRPIPLPGWLADPAGDGHGTEDFLYQLIYSWLYRGNAYGGVIARSRTGFIQQATLFHPDAVSGYIDGNGLIQWTVAGSTVASFNSEDGIFLHKRVNPVPGLILGESPIARAARQIGLSIAATNFGKSFFDADAMPVGILRNSLGRIEPEQARQTKDGFMASMRGNREPIVMGKGWEYDQLSVTPNESQFMETMGYTEAQCARMFGPGVAEILGYPTGQQLTYVNLQDRDIQLLKYSVGKWIRRAERFLNCWLPRPQYVVLDRDGLLETNIAARYAAYNQALADGWQVINEVRDRENLEPVPWGNEPLQLQQNAAAAPAEPADDEPDDDDIAGEDPQGDNQNDEEGDGQ